MCWRGHRLHVEQRITCPCGMRSIGNFADRSGCSILSMLQRLGYTVAYSAWQHSIIASLI